MTRRALSAIGLLACLLFSSASAAAADSVSGTFTVNGTATKFSQIYATLETDPQDPATHYLILLVSDLPIPPADRTPARLLALAKEKKIHALRMRWTYGTDTLVVVPYHAALDDSGRAFRQIAMIDITKYDDSNVDAAFTSKALGQSWQFTARVKAAVANGGVATLEPDAEAPPPPAGATAEAGTAAAVRQQLVGMGYQLRPEDLFQAIGDHNVAAVQLFLKAGFSPNVKADGDRYPLNHAVLFCAADPEKSAAIIIALVDAKGDVKTRDPDNKTTPLVGAVQSCKPEAIEALIKAGSDLTAKSAGGMTALQLADIFGRQDIAAILRKAGAK
jgi:hypothetical protein